ncbi:MAG: hypothetical protein EBV48_08980, partial [Betaproteobacteria bacterium]|nr:hypothetical protein [Betaproteobacteria bacterium]
MPSDCPVCIALCSCARRCSRIRLRTAGVLTNTSCNATRPPPRRGNRRCDTTACRLSASWLRGLVLVTGPTGSGKSTTLAALVDAINRERPAHIVTLEDPIEFVHVAQRSLISQREIGRDTASFETALRAALREDPDVLLVGELRDLLTMRLALAAAETGHLVLATVHTAGATSTIDRLVSVFPQGEQALVRNQLADSLQAVVSQRLLPRRGGGRVALHEVLV